MNHREPTSAPVGAGQAVSCLALLLLLMVAVARAWSRPSLPGQDALTYSKPYLVALGAPPLRFEEPAPPPDLVTRPPSAAPPLALPAKHEAAADVVAAAPAAPAAISTAAPAAGSAHESAAASESTDASAAPRTPPPILPDETRPQVHPEDFLPFFQIPASQSGDLNVVVPVPRAPATPATLPPSSATYTQTPR